MPLEKLQKPGFVYIAYRRNNIGDFSIFKSAIEASIKDGQNLQDIIIDLTKYPVLTDGEAGLLTKAIQRLQGTSRHIRIIAGNRVKEKLESINAQAIKTAVIYPSHEQFLEAFNKIWQAAAAALVKEVAPAPATKNNGTAGAETAGRTIKKSD